MAYKLFTDISNTALKSFVAIVSLFLIAKLSGKKHISKLTFFDYIVGIAIGSIAGSFSVSKSPNYTEGLTSIITWGLFAYAASYLSIKSIWGRRLIDSTPTVFVQNGKIIESNLKKEKININDFLEELRIKSVFNIADVEFAMLETDGQLSVQLKSQKSPLTPSDLNIPTKYKGLSANLIIDGKLMSENLKLVNLDEKLLKDELSKRNISSEKEVLLASLDTAGNLYISLKNDLNNEVNNVLE